MNERNISIPIVHLYLPHSKETSSLWLQLRYWTVGQLWQEARQLVDELVHVTLFNQIGWELDPVLNKYTVWPYITIYNCYRWYISSWLSSVSVLVVLANILSIITNKNESYFLNKIHLSKHEGNYYLNKLAHWCGSCVILMFVIN